MEKIDECKRRHPEWFTRKGRRVAVSVKASVEVDDESRQAFAQNAVELHDMRRKGQNNISTFITSHLASDPSIAISANMRTFTERKTGLLLTLVSLHIRRGSARDLDRDLAYRQHLADLAEAGGKPLSKQSGLCANPGCPAAGNDGLRLKTCAGCGRLRYCSKGCQTDHWKQGHRHECKERIGNYEENV